ncbi:N-acetylglucosamine kinase [Pseudonocardia sp. CA-107938]|uniref:N-acetylglucosamine kinase n=1 Tax=Pseudonocardia sp. CA-107938 TaxID=3240021 RepID=UPI003D8ADCF2
MTLVAVDGGQSGLRLTVVGSGQVHTGPGFAYQHDIVGPLVAAVGLAWAAAGAPGPVERAALGLTGLPSDEPGRHRLAAELDALWPDAELLLCADNVTAHAGLFRGARGVALTVGTGVNCLAVDPAAGASHRVDGWGHLLGDDGSGFAIGRAGLAAVLRAVDGRGSATLLAERAERRYGPVRLMPQGLYTSPTVVDDVARFAVDVLDAAEAGDAVALDVVTAAAEELARTAAAGVATLPGPAPVPVACSSRLLTRAVLREPWVAALARCCPRAILVDEPGSPLDGACHLTADAEAYRDLVHRYRSGEPR